MKALRLEGVWKVAVHVIASEAKQSVAGQEIASSPRAPRNDTSSRLARYPDIKFVSVESGIGWIPFALEALDYQFLGNRVQEERPDLDMLPSEYFARNIYACYWFEQIAPRRLIDKVGADKIMFETDFPHPTSLYGDEVHERIKAGLGDCDEEVRRKILWDNGQKLYKVEGPTEADEAKLSA